MFTRAIPFFSAVCVLVVGGCATPRIEPHFDARGFGPTYGGYRIDYADAERHQFLSQDWRVDNYELDEETEEPGHRESSHVDLELQHRRTHATLWVESFALGPAVEQTELRVLAERWVASIANHGYVQATIVGNEIDVRDRRYAATILDGRAISLKGEPAYAVLIDVANLNQAELDPNERSARVLAVFSRLPTSLPVRRGVAEGSTPLLFVAGYSNVPADFDASEADFERFLESITFVPSFD